MKVEELTQEGLDELVTSKETAETKVGELTNQLGERDTKLGEVQGQLATLTEATAERNEKLAVAEAATGEMATKLEEATSGLTSAIQSYKALVAQANPAIPEELITGNTIDELNQSLESATTLISKVRTSIEAEAAAAKVPAGAPPRTPPDLSTLSPREKIQYAVSKGGK